MTLKSPFDSKNIIWYISEVTPYNIKVHFPNSQLLKRFNHYWDSLHWWILGSFVAIEWETKWFIWKIVKLSLPEKERMELTESNYKNKELHPIWIVEILFSFDLLSFEAKKSIQDYPPISSKVYACSSELYIEILKNNKSKKNNDELEIWETLWTSEKISLSANHIFNRHCAILWTTWGGKSYTIAKMIEELVKKDNAKIILLDATWEFKLFDDKEYVENAIFNNHDWENSTFFSYKNFVFDDLVALFRPAWQTQLPTLEESVKILLCINELKDKYINTHSIEILDWKIFQKEWKSKKDFINLISKTHITNFNDFDINNLPYQIHYSSVQENLKGSWDNSISGYNFDITKYWWIDNWLLNNNQSLIFRIKSFLNNVENKSIFNLENININKNLFDSINWFISENSKKVFRIDLSNVPETWNIKGILVNAIWRYFLNNSKEWKYKDKPIIIFIDEAHLFLNKKIKDEYSIEVELNAFDRIAKECRKFWVFLCLSTQRPRDIPEWILSQIWTFIIHRLINDKDKQAVENASPSYSKEFLSFLPSLWEWEAIIMGVKFLTTLFLKIWKPDIEPNSDTPELFK